jgi:hypothetical protein
LISLKTFHIIIKAIIEENYFNIEEYQDKYYFKKKVQEFFPYLTDEFIFSTIDSFKTASYNVFHKEKTLQKLSEKLYTGVLNCYERRLA